MTGVRLTVAARREELLRAAVGQIAARGVTALRISDVASALGVSNALVLYHFATKEKLVAAAFAYAADGDLVRLRALLARRTSATRRLRAALRWYAPTDRSQGWPLWIESWAAALREPGLREVARGLDRQWKAAIAGVIAEGAESGEFRCPDPAAAALRLTALLDGLAVQLTSYRGTVSRARALRWVDDALARELGLEPAELRAHRR
ncbi:TetR family transcriptional regulator C-terminal domain-containing protein [Streptomyces sp. SID8352]|uniref:TetR family transcriptional regulator C-terminal domain-containing protein n=1 Tax=Streptomyces sp. SID8352 TaxID=2690338 RepID=UPI001369A7F8|nr:TetR family transcriptional regulator [Streptomyces sp. SID8352]